jgi:RHS repeat-associated protein
VVERYLWADATRLLATYDASSTLTSRFTYADGRMPALMTTSEGTFHLAYDQVGTLVAVVASSGAVVKSVVRDSFGNLVLDSAPALPVPLGFAGGLEDPDTGLVHFGARDYDPALGRFTARDPIDVCSGDMTLYSYCGQDPVGRIDPSGLLFSGLLDAGEAYGQYATDYWACMSVNTDNWFLSGLYTVGGIFAAMWTPTTSDTTFMVLTTAWSLSGMIAKVGAALPAELAGGAKDTFVYFLKRNGEVFYAGITKNPNTRLAAHMANFGDDITMELLNKGAPLTRGAARAVEEVLIRPQLGTWANKIGSIAQTHEYYSAAVAFGTAWLRSQGIPVP